MLVFDNLTLKNKIKRVEETSSTILFNTSYIVNKFTIDSENIIDFDSNYLKLKIKTMREACIFEDLIAI
jgi:hypothetical protein